MTYPFSWQEIEISRFLLHLLRMVDPLGIALVFACWNGIVTLFKLHVLSMVVLAVLLGLGISRYYEPLVSFMKGEYLSFCIKTRFYLWSKAIKNMARSSSGKVILRLCL